MASLIAEFRRLARFRRRELMLATLATVGVLTFDILYGVLLASGMSVIDLLWGPGPAAYDVLGTLPGVQGMHDVDDSPAAREPLVC